MIVVMDLDSTDEEIKNVEERLKDLGFSSQIIRGVEKIVIGAVGGNREVARERLELLNGVEKVVSVMAPYKIVSREYQEQSSVIKVGDLSVGGKEIVVMAGPCAVESHETLFSVAASVAQSGARMLRGGAFKPRTSPYSFQGMEKEGLELLAQAREKTGLKIVTEVINPQDVGLVGAYADVLQVGARNMQNFALLKEVGQQEKPVLLKRGLSATIEEWLMAAEYIAAGGNINIILCERGIRTFETYTRNTLDISAVPLVKQLSHLPVVVDPSHSSGSWKLVAPLARAALAAGADGLIVEVHPDPANALSDGPQSLTPTHFQELMDELAPLASLLGRTIEARSCSL